MRPSGGTGQPTKPTRRKPGQSKPPMKATAPKRGRRSSQLSDELTSLRRELSEAREQQTTTADVLKIVGRSTYDLQTVLDTLTESAARLCQAEHSFMFLREDDGYHCVSGSSDIPEWIDYLKQQTIQPGRGTVAARAVLEARTVHIPDVCAHRMIATGDSD
jgi:two-component system, NtrC family, sensor kinase